MSAFQPKPEMTLAEMFKGWLPTATQGKWISDKDKGRSRVSYYAGAHNMDVKMAEILKVPNVTHAELERQFHNISVEINRFIETYHGEPYE